jgi:hypothetical protein
MPVHDLAVPEGIPGYLKPNLGKEFALSLRTESNEARVFRYARQMEILCRLTYEVTPFRNGLFRWFLIGIEELE